MTDETKKNEAGEEPITPVENEAENDRRRFLKTTVGIAVGAGVAATTGIANAQGKGGKGCSVGRPQAFLVSSRIEPDALTPENIQKISDAIAQTLAQEAKRGIELGMEPDNFHIRFGGGHSRTFSKTADHKNVSHSRTIITGTGDI